MATELLCHTAQRENPEVALKNSGGWHETKKGTNVVVVVESLHASGEAEKETSSDVHEAMTRWVQSGTHVVPEYPCHNPAEARVQNSVPIT